MRLGGVNVLFEERVGLEVRLYGNGALRFTTTAGKRFKVADIENLALSKEGLKQVEPRMKQKNDRFELYLPQAQNNSIYYHIYYHPF